MNMMASSRLPEPTFSFLIPSQQDGLKIQCRIYHPECSFFSEFIMQPSCLNLKAVIVAHPYTALGGSMDDYVVGQIASTFLQEGYIVGTFNFRGAGQSEGSTSWQSKSEQDDYMSFIGFMATYLHDLHVPKSSSPDQPQSDKNEFLILDTNSPQDHELSYPLGDNQYDSNTYPSTRLVLAGYSYGALITMSLPADIKSILAPFQAPLIDSVHGKICHKAKILAEQRNLSNKNLIYTNKQYRTRNSSSFDNIHARESSSDARLDIQEIKSSPEGSKSERASTSLSRHGSQNLNHNLSVNKLPKAKEILPVIRKIWNIKVSYLLVSPIQGFVCDLLTLWSFKSWRQRNVLNDKDIKFKLHQTLAIYGEGDKYVSSKSIRSWAEKLASPESGQDISQFRFVEIPGAGHFWNDSQSVACLRAEIRNFVKTLGL